MRTRKLLSVVLAFAMVLSLLPMSVMAAEFDDAKGHWAESSINRWSDAGVLNGDADGFHPNGSMTRATAAQTFVNLLGLKSTEGAKTFSDVNPNAWYADALAKANAAGIVGGVSETEAAPDMTVNRETFLTMFARGLGIKPQETSSANVNNDASSWAAGYINALTEKGYVGGVDDAGNVGAAQTMNRASMATLLDKTITTYANEPGATVEGTGDGVILVVADDVTVTGNVDTLVVAEGAQDENGSASVTLENATVENLNVVAEAEVALEGTTSVETVAVAEAAEGASLTVAAGAKVETVEVEAANTEISGSGEVASVSATGEAADTVAVSTPNTEVATSKTVENADGSVTETKTESKNDAAGKSTGTTTTETTTKETTAADGSKTTTETVAETKTDASGKVTESTTTTTETTANTDGTTTEKVTETKTDANGTTTTTTSEKTTDASGNEVTDAGSEGEGTTGGGTVSGGGVVSGGGTVSGGGDVSDPVTADATLKSLSYSLDGAAAIEVNNFSSGTYNYNVALPYGTGDGATLLLGGEATDDDAEVTPGAQVALSSKEAEATITVTNGTATKTYTVKFTVATEQSTDATLKSLGLPSGVSSDPAFTASITTYTVTVAEDVTSITITPIATDPSATLTVGGTATSKTIELNPGDNAVAIVVTPQKSGAATKTYNVTITRTAPVVTLNANGGSLGTTTEQTVDADGKITLLTASDTGAAPTRTGYTLAGWTADAAGNSALTNDSVYATSTTIYAKWTAKSIHVNYNTHGGDGSLSSGADVNYDAEYSSVASANAGTKAGYTFAGWYTAETGGAKVETTTKMTSTEAVTLHAQWTPNTYTVSFDKNGGEGAAMADQTLTYGAETQKLTKNTYTREGYTFGGWYKAAEYNPETNSADLLADEATIANAALAKVNISNVDSDTNGTVYAVWTAAADYKVTYNANGVTPDTAATNQTGKKLTDAIIIATALTDSASSDKKTFTGWNTKQDGSGTVYAAGATPTMEQLLTAAKKDVTGFSGKEVTLYAQWQTITPLEITLEAVASTPVVGQAKVTIGGESVDGTISYALVSTKPAEPAANSALPALGDGAAYATGSPNSKVNGVTYPGTVAEDYADNTLYLVAYLVKDSKVTGYGVVPFDDHTVQVTFKANDGKTDPVTEDTKKALASGDSSTTLESAKGGAFTRDGYTFAGWNTAANGSGTAYAASATPAFTTDQTLYAQWTAKIVTVNFYDGAKGEGTKINDLTTTVKVGEKITAPEGPAKAGYTFNEWVTANGGSTAYDFTKAVTPEQAAGIDIFAKYTGNTITVTFDGNGATGGTTAAKTFTYDGGSASQTATANGFTRTDYTFLGWNTDKDAAETTVENNGEVEAFTEDTTLYAIWKQNTATVTLKLVDADDELATPKGATIKVLISKASGATAAVEETVSLTSEQQSKAMSAKLPVGTYSYEVTTAPTGYETASGTFEIKSADVDGNGKAKTVNIPLEKSAVAITFAVTNGGETKYAGATVTVFTGTGDDAETVDTKTTNSRGEAVFNLKPGDYGYTVAKDGFITVKKANAADDKLTVTALGNEAVTLTAAQVTLTIKAGETGHEAAVTGKELTVTLSGNGNTVTGKTVSSTGKVAFTSVLPAGNYTVTVKDYTVPTTDSNNIVTVKADASVEADVIVEALDASAKPALPAGEGKDVATLTNGTSAAWTLTNSYANGTNLTVYEESEVSDKVSGASWNASTKVLTVTLKAAPTEELTLEVTATESGKAESEALTLKVPSTNTTFTSITPTIGDDAGVAIEYDAEKTEYEISVPVEGEDPVSVSLVVAIPADAAMTVDGADVDESGITVDEETGAITVEFNGEEDMEIAFHVIAAAGDSYIANYSVKLVKAEAESGPEQL